MKKKNITQTVCEEHIIDGDYAEAMKKNYVDYAMSVIVSRAIPDIRDGLKPVQRRILYDCNELGVSSDKDHRKVARIVGDTMGKYHPHGDSAISDALVVMAQDFKKQEILISGHGNFGSIEGDKAAAARYIEARLAPFSEKIMLQGITHNTIDFVPNFDGTEKEPVVLPARLPQLLINGAEGIAVGMTTSIPPHNTKEVLRATIEYLKNKKITIDKLMQTIPGPDFPTGGIITTASDLAEIYKTGMGKIKIRGKAHIEKNKKGNYEIVITEIPYTMIGQGMEKFLLDVEKLAYEQEPEIIDIMNQTSKDGVRIVIELRKTADAKRILSVLYKKTKLEDTFSVNMLSIHDGKPETYGMLDILKAWSAFRVDFAKREYQFFLQKEKDALEISEGLLLAVDMIDTIIEVIRGSKTRQQAFECLTTGKTAGIVFKTKSYEKTAKKMSFTDRQATAILDMRLASLIGLEINALQKRANTQRKNVEKYTKILSSDKNIEKEIIKELQAMEKDLDKKRKTELTDIEEETVQEKAQEREFLVSMDENGYVSVITRKPQKDVFYATITESEKIYVITSRGDVCAISGVDIFKKKSVAIDAISDIDQNEEAILCAFTTKDVDKTILLITESGFTKKVLVKDVITRKKRVSLFTAKEDVHLLVAEMIEPKKEVYVDITTSSGYRLLYSGNEVPLQKRASGGVVAVKLKDGEKIETAVIRQSVKDASMLSHRGRRGTKTAD